MLVGLAWREDAGRTHGTARPKRKTGSRVPKSAQEGEAGVLSRTTRSSSARTLQKTNVGFRIDDHIRDRFIRQRAKNVAQSTCLLPWRIAGRGRDSHLSSGNHDPRGIG